MILLKQRRKVRLPLLNWREHAFNFTARKETQKCLSPVGFDCFWRANGNDKSSVMAICTR